MSNSPELPPGAVAYLRAATRLLLPGMRQTVCAELHANLYQAVLDHRTRGRTEEAAWAAALRDLGPAWQVALGLARTHTLPLLLRLCLATGALGGVASALWTHTTPTTQEARP